MSCLVIDGPDFPRHSPNRLSLSSLSPLSLPVTNGSSHSPTALNGAPSPPNGYSNGPSSSSSSSLANQQLPPACGARQLSKLKRFLTTLQQFGNDISPEIGERVRTLVLGLVVSGRGLPVGGWAWSSSGRAGVVFQWEGGRGLPSRNKEVIVSHVSFSMVDMLYNHNFVVSLVYFYDFILIQDR